MDFSEINISEGGSLLDDFNRLPRRIQELIMAFISYDIDKDKNETIKVITDMLCRGGISYEKCQSPIEEIFSFAYEFLIVSKGFPISELFNLFPQQTVCANGHKYKVDFLFDTERLKLIHRDHPLKLAIECDGHDFHERTKTQVEKGNNRDYDLKMAGYEILHFSGSQIYNEPMKCALEVYDFIRIKVGNIRIEFDEDENIGGNQDGNLSEYSNDILD